MLASSQSYYPFQDQPSASILSHSAAQGLLDGLNPLHASEFHFDPSAPSSQSLSKRAPPPRPARSPLPSSSSPNRNALVPGLGFHLSAQRRSAKPHSNSSPSDYSHETSSSSDSDGVVTESDRPDARIPQAEEYFSDAWQDSDNYQSPVWASRWNRSREDSMDSRDGGLDGSNYEGSIGSSGSRRPSYQTFARPSSSLEGRRRSSSSSTRGRRESGGGNQTRRSSSNSAAFPNFPFPFPAGGAPRRLSRPTVAELNLNSPKNVLSGGSRRGSEVSVHGDDDQEDGWDDLDLQNEGGIDRRGSYDSTFAFDSASYRGSISYSPTNTSFLSASFPNRRAGKPSAPPSAAETFAPMSSLRRPSYGPILPIPGLGMGAMRKSSWDARRASTDTRGTESPGERERMKRLGGMRELNRRESEVLEVQGKGGRYGLQAELGNWMGQSHWSPSTVASPPSPPTSESLSSSDSGDESHSPPQSGHSAQSSMDATRISMFSTLHPNISLTFSFEEEGRDPLEVNIPDGTVPSGLPMTFASSQSIPSLSSASFSDSDDDEVEDANVESCRSSYSFDGTTGAAQIKTLKRISMTLLSPVAQAARQHQLVATTGPADSVDAPESDLAYLASTIRVTASPTLPSPAQAFAPSGVTTALRGNGHPSSTQAPSTTARRPALSHSQSMPQFSQGSTTGPRKFDRMAAFLATTSTYTASNTAAILLPSHPVNAPSSHRKFARRAATYVGAPAYVRCGASSSSDEELAQTRLPTSRVSPTRSSHSGSGSGGEAASAGLNRRGGSWEGVAWGARKGRSSVVSISPPASFKHVPLPAAASSSSPTRPLSIFAPPSADITRAALPFETAFVARAQEEIRQAAAATASAAGNKAATTTPSATAASSPSSSELCYCGTAYLASTRRASRQGPHPRHAHTHDASHAAAGVSVPVFRPQIISSTITSATSSRQVSPHTAIVDLASPRAPAAAPGAPVLRFDLPPATPLKARGRTRAGPARRGAVAAAGAGVGAGGREKEGKGQGDKRASRVFGKLFGGKGKTVAGGEDA